MLIHISTNATIKQGTIMIGDQYSFAGLAATSLKLNNNIYFARNYIRIGVFFFLTIWTNPKDDCYYHKSNRS
jgi:hypothetical protein